MRKFCFLAVAAAAMALLSVDQAQAGGRRTRYYSYGGTAVTPRATSQAAQSTTTRRYSYAPSANVRYSNSPANGSFTMGSTPYNSNSNYWRADRKIKGY
jgi:hypothetical protein